MSDEQIATRYEAFSAKDVFLFPVKIVVNVLAFPITALAFIISAVKRRNYDPEKVVCPGCGFKGDSGTYGKTCRIVYYPVAGAEKAVNKHSCFRCGADFFTPLFLAADKWAAKQLPQDKLTRAAQRTVL